MHRITFYVHWLVGLIAGTLLMVIGASGALLAFENQILDSLNPGVRVVAPGGRTVLSPPEMIQRLQRNLQGHDIGNVTVYAEPTRSARVMLQAARGDRATIVYADPYSGATLGPAAGQAFFDWTERLHRFLLLPREAGRMATGILSGCLLLLLFSGIYLRWPRRVASLRDWLSINPRLRGRALLGRAHAVVATWVIPLWLILACTGIYWAFDTVRSTVDGFAGVQRQLRPKPLPSTKSYKTESADWRLAWAGFATQAGAWRNVRLSSLRPSAESIEFVWLPQDAAHERALNRMQVSLDGRVLKDERFAAQSAGRRVLAAIYPLHMGRYFGLSGQIAVMLAALALPLLGVTGWWMSLQRRTAHMTGCERKDWTDDLAEPDAEAPAILVAYASQTGRAERLALRTARSLQQAGHRIILRSLAQLSPLELVGYPQALFIVSTYGDGQAPDLARGFARALAKAGQRLDRLSYAVLALGNRQYPHFCGFGRFLHERLQQLGAVPQAGLRTVCESQTDGYREWFDSLQHMGLVADSLVHESESENAGWMECILEDRQLLNAASQGAPLYGLSLRAKDGEALPHWEAGALLEVRPRHALVVVQAWARKFGLDPDGLVELGGRRQKLLAVLARRKLPDEFDTGGTLQLAQLPLLTPRRYSVSSIVQDACLQLIVRQHVHAGGLGLASGWLTQYCQIGAEISVRLLPNPAFGVSPEAVPCLFVGAGSGLAGLRGLLRERIRLNLGRNWLVLGERNAQYDTLCATELDSYCRAGMLEIIRVFSRDTTYPVYVQDRLREYADRLRQLVAAGGVIHVCGSRRGMGEGVDTVLREVLGYSCVDDLVSNGRYRRDVY
jgi:sulfite reductase (NADPH) flavoprotein alpha-component